MKDLEKSKETLIWELAESRRRVNELEASITDLLAENSRNRRRPGGSAGTIMVVDDEDAFRETMGRLMGSLGYTVLQAASGEEALEVLRSEKGRVDLVLLDMVMKGMGGTETFQKMRQLIADLPIIICTGNAVAAQDALSGATQQLLARAGITFMQKPIKPEHLARKLEKLIH
ncbi:MAG: response regulator [PVC group bacterium]